MRYFNTAVRLGSISKASEELNIAASAVSTSITQIENHFQLRLVNRQRSRGIEVTAAGKVMERKFKALLEDYDSLLLDGAELKQALRGDLKIGYYAPIAPAFLPTILLRLSGLSEKITFHLDEADNDKVQDSLIQGVYDAIIFVSEATMPQIEFDVLTEVPAFCLLAEDHPLAKQKEVRLSELVLERIIMLNRPIATDYYRRMFEQVGDRSRTVAYANSVEMVRSMVGSGQGVAILNMLPLTEISYSGDRLVALPITDKLPPLTLAIGYNKTAPRRIVKYFAECCSSYFAATESSKHTIDPIHNRV